MGEPMQLRWLLQRVYWMHWLLKRLCWLPLPSFQSQVWPSLGNRRDCKEPSMVDMVYQPGSANHVCCSTCCCALRCW